MVLIVSSNFKEVMTFTVIMNLNSVLLKAIATKKKKWTSSLPTNHSDLHLCASISMSNKVLWYSTFALSLQPGYKKKKCIQMSYYSNLNITLSYYRPFYCKHMLTKELSELLITSQLITLKGILLMYYIIILYTNFNSIHIKYNTLIT